MSNNRVIADLAQTLSTSSGGSIKVSNGSLISDVLNDSDYNGTPIAGFSDSSEVATVITTGYISQQVGSVRDSSGIKSYLQGNIGTSFNPLTSATYNIGDSSNPIDEIILDSSASIFFGSISLTSILKSGTSTIAVAAAAAGPVSGSAETSFLLKTDSTQTDAQVDASTNAFTITESGNVKSTAFTPYHPAGYSVYFDGSGDYLRDDTIADDLDNTGDNLSDSFTMELWVYDETPAEDNCIISSNSTATGANDFLLMNNDILWLNSVKMTFSLTANTWHHLVVEYDRSSGNYLSCWLDGTRVNRVSVSGAMSFANNHFAFGAESDAGNFGSLGNYFQGYMHDVKISKEALYGDVTSITVPTSPTTPESSNVFSGFTKGYIAKDFTVGGNVKTEIFSPYDHVAYSPSSHGGSVYFDGTGDYLRATSSVLAEGTDDFTLECWFYIPTSFSPAQNDTLFGHDATPGYQISWNSGGFTFMGDTSTRVLNTTNVTTDIKGAWHHIAYCRSGNTLYGFLDGQSLGTSTNSVVSTNFTNTTIDVGVNRGGTEYFQGWISDLRIVKGTAVYTSDFTPPTEPLTAISGTQLLTCTNKNSVYDAAAGQDVTATGDAAASTTQYKWSSSTAFDDNGDYLTATVDPPGTGDYTLECWVRFNSMSAGNQSILSFGNYSPAIYYRSSSSELAVYYSSAFYLSGFTPVADTWYHIAWTRSGTSCRLFVDGVQKGTTASNAHNVNNTNLRIGYDGVDYFGGYIEDVRYTKGLARYTADFTPPTAALEG